MTDSVATREGYATFPFGTAPIEAMYLPLPSGGGEDASAIWDDSPSFEATESAERLFWSRWVNGHQAVFGIWQRLHEALDQAISDQGSRSSALVRAALLTDAYSAVLLYCGSAPRDLYEKSIRQIMANFHPAFSGKWSRDYAGIPAKSSQLRSCITASKEMRADVYMESLRRNRQIHIAVAEKLVPDGVSLLRQHRGEADDDCEDAGALFDAFFGVVRIATDRSHVDRQTCHRLSVILADLDGNGLYPQVVPGASERPDRLRDGPLQHFECSVSDVLAHVRSTLITA